MSSQIACPYPQTSLTQTISRVLSSGQIARTDRQTLNLAARSEQQLSPEEQAGIQEVWSRLQRGWLRVID